MRKILHYPNLKTILIVENILKEEKNPISREDIKRLMMKKIMHQTLNLILIYLEESGKIIDNEKGVKWIFKTDEQLKKIIEKDYKLYGF